MARHFNGRLVSAAMQLAVQRTERSRDTRFHRCQRGCHNSRGKRAGIEAVIKLQNLNLFESTRRIGRRPSSGDLGEHAGAVVFNVGHVRRRIFFASTGADDGQHGGQQRGDAYSPVHRIFVGRVVEFSGECGT